MYLIGDIGNTEIKVCLVDNNNKIVWIFFWKMYLARLIHDIINDNNIDDGEHMTVLRRDCSSVAW